MKAIVQDRYGSIDALRLAEVERPTPKDDEVLVRVRATAVHADVWHVVKCALGRSPRDAVTRGHIDRMRP